MTDAIVLGLSGDDPVGLPLAMANRHGLVAGATGTGKTVSLQRLAEGFSQAGVPVFLADVKGDLSGLARPATPNDRIAARVSQLGRPGRPFGWQPAASPVLFFDLEGKQGHPIRATVSDMGPLLLATLLDLNDIQSGVLTACFKLADDQGLLLLDLKDLKALLVWAAVHNSEFKTEYGNLSSASIASIQRGLITLEQAGAEAFFGEPMLSLDDLMHTDFSGQGVISILDASRLIQNPRLYVSFLLWLLSELFEQLLEIGDADKPRLVFFFDEAHLLFETAPPALLDKIEQVVRLIRSKGVGVYFITQNPLDLPESVLGQLGHRVQHALRAFTPKDQKAVRAAAQTFRARPGLDTERVITELAVGEALVSVLDESGTPTPVAHTLIAPPASRIGPLSADERRDVLARSPIKGRYDQSVDRESAYELLKTRADKAAASGAAPDAVTGTSSSRSSARTSSPREPESMGMAMAKSALRAVGSQLGRSLVRGVLGSLLGGRRR